MVVLSSSVRYAINYIKRSYICHNLYTSSSLNGRNSIKTVKVFSDLPTTFLRPDGTTAEPLPEWRGESNRRNIFESGVELEQKLDLPSKKRKAETTYQCNPLQNYATPLSPTSNVKETTSELSIKPKRNIKRQLKPLPSNFPLLTQTTPDDAIIKKWSGNSTDEPSPLIEKRSRKKVENIDDSGLSIPRPKRIVTAKNSIHKRGDVDSQPQNNLAQEILENLRKYPHCLLLTRVGQFYESYFDQATDISRLLNIKLTTRKWDGSRIPMCGFPLAHLDKYLKVLVQQNRRFVAMCEEFPRYSSQGIKIFDRRVSRIVTPGTLIDESFLNPYENNYLLAIGVHDPIGSINASSSLGLAWIDVSTGEFFSNTTTLDNLRDELARIGPREVILDSWSQHTKSHPIFQALAEDDHFVSFICLSKSDDRLVPGKSVSSTTSSNATMHLPGHEIRNSTNTIFSSQETLAISLLTTYLHTNLLEHMPTLSSPNREGTESRMQIDSHTIKALEIREGIREGGTRGSLLNTIRRTLTSGGTRLLSRWLCSPSTSIVEINMRQSLVAFFCSRPHFRVDLAEIIGNADDTGRIVQKFSLSRGDSNDLLAVKRTAQMWDTITKRIDQEKQLEAIELENFNQDDWGCLDALMSRMVGLHDLSKRISAALEDSSSAIDDSSICEPLGADDEPPSNSDPGSNTFWRQGQGKWSIKPGFSLTLTTLHNTLQRLLYERERLECRLQLTYDAPSLTLRASPAQGMHVHLAKSRRDQAKINATPEFVTIAESGSTRCYFYKEWSQLGSQIAETTMSLGVAEREAFETLRDEVNSHSLSLRRNAKILDELDVVLAFANLATEMNFVRPVLTDDTTYTVVNGRHPTVEMGLLRAGRVFTPNSVKLSPESRLHVITGPNMAGKSTFLRQTALIAILAQAGSFVPADSVVVGIVDKLFSRVGAKDDLFHDRSTFMVEMLETAEILRRATPKSLVIMDEVGRGTTVTDGLAIAYATVDHLISRNKCRSLFATHFHELSDMLGCPDQPTGKGVFANVGFFCTDVDETTDGRFTYQYRVRPGVNRDSHGLKVAHLAGMPPAAMKVAEDTLSWLKTQNINWRRSSANV